MLKLVSVLPDNCRMFSPLCMMDYIKLKITATYAQARIGSSG
jgi:hypothetical protein